MIVLFSPLLLVQAVAVCYALLRLLEQLWLMLPLSEPNSTRRLAYFAKGDDCCGFLHHGSRCAHFLGPRWICFNKDAIYVSSIGLNCLCFVVSCNLLRRITINCLAA